MSLVDRTLFIAGSTGAVGQTVIRQARQANVAYLAHERPRADRPPRTDDSRTLVFPMDDEPRLIESLRHATTVVQLIGTVRKRFALGDTYETSDIGTTHLLVEAAKAAGTIDHFVLLTSVGAGRPVGAYLKAKATAEALVKNSGLPFSIFRPSAFDGAGHHSPPGLAAVTRLFGLTAFQPIAVETLARAILNVAKERCPLGILQGASLFAAANPRAA